MFHLRSASVLISVFLVNCATSPDIGYSVVLDQTLEKDRGDYENVIGKGVFNIKEYAKGHGWESLGEKPIITKAEVVADRARLKERLIEIYDVPADTEFPLGLTAANDAKSLLLIMPEGVSKKYSAKFIEKGFYEKLITHELAHLLHIRILGGEEENMGPIWFYEGFAVVVSNQLKDFKWSPTKKEMQEIMTDPKRGDYRQYGFIVRELLKRHPMKTLVNQAKLKDFNAWALSEIFPKSQNTSQ